MASSFKGHDLFGSGPHRFAVGKQGPFVFSLSALGTPSAESVASGFVELDVTVRGRLVAASESALWTLRDAVTAELIDPPVKGTLVDSRGHSWADMSFITFVEEDRTDRGRPSTPTQTTVSYTAVFRRFTHPPT